MNYIEGGLPTLLKPGSIIDKSFYTKEQKKDLKIMKPIDFILKYLSTYCPYLNTYKTPRSWGDRFFLLESGTGSGKSTNIPPYILLNFYNKRPKNICVCQPTVATARSIPIDTVQYFPKLKLGDNIGYQTGSFKLKPKNKGIIHMTYGTLQQQIKTIPAERFLSKYAVIFIDEVHFRTMPEDNLLMQLKILIQNNWKNPKCPLVILMSATFDKKTFYKYFEIPKNNYIEVVGLSYPIKINFPKYDINNYYYDIVDLVQEINLTNDSDFDTNFTDIIIFLPGNKMINDISRMLHNLNSTIFDKYKKYISILECSGTTIKDSSSYTNKYLFTPINNYKIDIYNTKKNKKNRDVADFKSVKYKKTAKRKVLIATNAIETGFSLDTLKYCIDSGYSTNVSYNPKYDCKQIMVSNITQASALQRKGRVGRKGDGIWFPCYREEIFNKFIKDKIPEIYLEDLTESILDLIQSISNTRLDIEENSKIKEDFNIIKINNEFKKLVYDNKIDIKKLPFINPIQYDSIYNSLEKAHILGYLNSDYNLNLLYIFSTYMRKISLKSKRMILSGFIHGAYIIDLISLACLLELGGWKSINTNKKEPYKLPLKFDNTPAKDLIKDDFINLILVFNLFKKQLKINKNKLLSESIIEWCNNNDYNYKTFMYVIELQYEIVNNLLDNNINIQYNSLKLKDYNLIDIITNNIKEGENEIIKIKKCILDGYRMNLCKYNENEQIYKRFYKPIPSNIGIHNNNNLIKEENPKYIIYDDIVLKYNNKLGNFGITIDNNTNISILTYDIKTKLSANIYPDYNFYYN